MTSLFRLLKEWILRGDGKTSIEEDLRPRHRISIGVFPKFPFQLDCGPLGLGLETLFPSTSCVLHPIRPKGVNIVEMRIVVAGGGTLAYLLVQQLCKDGDNAVIVLSREVCSVDYPLYLTVTCY
jgi:hypothetical protein